jgi:hypothetical protein
MSCAGCMCMSSDSNPLTKICGRSENGFVYNCEKSCCKVDCSGASIQPMALLTARTNKLIQNEPLLIGNNLMTATVTDTPSILPGAPFQKIKAYFQDSNTPRQMITLMAVLMFLVILSTVLLFF